jgi:GR25 family glycosyltransferase involved in LPS biosynthesis
VRFFSNFDRIYCINLAHRKDRWLQCLRQFELFEITDCVIPYRPKPFHFGSLSKKANAQLSCAFSHYSILKDAYNSKHSSVLVLEDDFFFPSSVSWTTHKLEKSWSELPKTWDTFHLSAYFVQGYHYKPATRFSENLVTVKTGFCNHAVAYSSRGLSKIMSELVLESPNDLLKFAHEFEAIDWYMVRWFQNQNGCFAPDELVCIQSPGHSDIEGQFYDYSKLFSSSYADHITGTGS